SSEDLRVRPPKDRLLRANDRHFSLSFHYTDAIKTAKYDIITFLPHNVFMQLTRLSKVYFLLLPILQVETFSLIISWFTTAVPLVIVLSITGIKDAINYINRSDRQVNNRTVEVLIDGKLKQERWKNVQVGEILILENNHFVPADVLLLSTSEPLNLVYVETTDLDGSLTLMTVILWFVITTHNTVAFQVKSGVNPPNNNLDTFTGTLIWNGKSIGLDNNKVLRRGCTLRNTKWCFGLLIFAGKLFSRCVIFILPFHFIISEPHLPLCTCGMRPFAASLRRYGALIKKIIAKNTTAHVQIFYHCYVPSLSGVDKLSSCFGLLVMLIERGGIWEAIGPSPFF
uniref:P-type ATPase N-terminal domain-containing protein n=1 Tax=Oryzias latipes TaxID=8090 RepID=A0A3P9L256_ORYLA